MGARSNGPAREGYQVGVRAHTSHHRHGYGRRGYRRRRARARVVLVLVLVLAGLVPALSLRFALSTRPAPGPHMAALLGFPDAPSPMPMPMPATPGQPGTPTPPVPPGSPLYASPANDAPLSASDRDFLVRVRQAGLWEGPAGQLAQVRAASPLVREAGQHMIAGHAELDATVLALGRQLNVPLPSQPSDAQRGWLNDIVGARSPQEFDQIFVNRLRAAHGVVFVLVAQVRATTRNSVIRSFAQRVLEVVLDHMTMLERTGLVDYGRLPQPVLLPGAADVATRQTPSGPLTAADHDFLVRVRLAGLWEGPSGRLAQQRGASTRVKEAGQHMIAGHSELDASVLAIGRRLGVDLPTEPNHDQKTWLGEMVSAPDAHAFDQVFVDRLRPAHGTVYGFVAAVRADTGNSTIRSFAQRVLEVVLDHMTMLERTGLVRYDRLPPGPQPSPAAATAPRPRRPFPSGILLYLLVAMFAGAAIVTVAARRDMVPSARPARDRSAAARGSW